MKWTHSSMETFYPVTLMCRRVVKWLNEKHYTFQMRMVLRVRRQRHGEHNAALSNADVYHIQLILYCKCIFEKDVTGFLKEFLVYLTKHCLITVRGYF